MSNRGLGFYLLALAILGWSSCGPSTSTVEPSYKVAAEWDGACTRAQKLEEPQGIAVSTEGEVFVADARACRVQVFSPMLIVHTRIGPAVRLLDEAVRHQGSQSPVEVTWLDMLAWEPLLEGLHDAVPVALALHENQQDMENHRFHETPQLLSVRHESIEL